MVILLPAACMRGSILAIQDCVTPPGATSQNNMHAQCLVGSAAPTPHVQKPASKAMMPRISCMALDASTLIPAVGYLGGLLAAIWCVRI